MYPIKFASKLLDNFLLVKVLCSYVVLYISEYSHHISTFSARILTTVGFSSQNFVTRSQQFFWLSYFFAEEPSKPCFDNEAVRTGTVLVLDETSLPVSHFLRFSIATSSLNKSTGEISSDGSISDEYSGEAYESRHESYIPFVGATGIVWQNG